jgi:hypothetical protein
MFDNITIILTKSTLTNINELNSSQNIMKFTKILKNNDENSSQFVLHNTATSLTNKKSIIIGIPVLIILAVFPLVQ